ncbi:MAG TPA: protease pro-enzyme activation domain-containing protein [Acidobacteriaceae bacterium]|nr:protease pro-enzyme activation domain-containing protein [Acidobacteriaceae bacterium]
MKTLMQCLQRPLSLSVWILAFAAASTLPASAAGQDAAVRAGRITAEISSSQMTQIPGSKHPLALAEFNTGRVAAGTKLQGMSIHFNRTAAQELDLQKLIAAQQDPASPSYHQWLTPEQFASRFGMADADIAKVESWLEQQGFAVDSVARGKTMIRFSGTVGQAEAAFATELHTYSVKTATGVENHFAPSTALSVPSALAGVVEGVHNLDDFRPRSHAIKGRNPQIKNSQIKPAFTSSQTNSVFFAPGDIATIYDLQKVYNAGFTGTGQTITIVGQSAVALSDIEAFQTAAGLPVKDPNVIVLPNSGTPTVFSGDESESDLDLEWSGAIAKGATINFVFPGDDTNVDAFDSIEYAIDNKIGTIISSSYGTCEANLGTFSLESSLAQAAAQGQTVISASGDDGSTDCFQGTNVTNPTLAAQEKLAVDYPASSQYVTGMGGTEISTSSSSYITAGDGYWQSASGSDVISSALKYIPEQAWNEDSSGCGQNDCLNSGGGGASALFPKPTWQKNVNGIPSDGKRDVPDISLNASTGLPGYLFCTSDTSFWSSQQAGSCNSGFRDATTGDLTLAGGTSFAAPIFAGMLALINEQQGYVAGQGLVNPTLYTLAANSSTYGTAFHDITTGDNDCRAGSTYCSGTIGFSAATGYDQATGLGTLDLYNLANAWPVNSGSTAGLIGTTTTITAANTAPTVNTSDAFTISVTSQTGATVPAGTVSIKVDTGTAVAETLTANGTYIDTITFTTAGSHTIVANYSGDATHAASTGAVTVNVATTSSGTGSFTVAAGNITVSQGSAGTSTITVTPSGGYTGTVGFSLSTSSSDIQNDTCFTLGNALVSGTSAATTVLTIDTNASNCTSTSAVRKAKGRIIKAAGFSGGLDGRSGPVTGLAVMAGLLMAGLLGRYSRKLRVLAGVILLAAVGVAFTGCGGSSSNTTPNAPKGSYTITVTGQDTNTASIQATTTFTLTIQ